jgi:two-component system NtrC family sensor kinase
MIADRLRGVAEQTELDFLGIVTKDGKTLCRIGPNSFPSNREPLNPLANLVLKNRVAVSGTMVLSKDLLVLENPDLAQRSRIRLLPTEKAHPRTDREITSGMVLAAAVPIFESGKFLGVLYGGVLLNQSQEIVDRVRDTVFEHEIYKGRSVGTSTIFLNDIRISTNVLNTDGSRAVGTMASEEVARHVLTGGGKWTNRAFVVNDWYISCYEPIQDIFGQRIGMLYAGVLEAKYADMRSDALSIFVLISLAGMALALGLGFVIANRISRPVNKLIEASAQVSQGNLSPEIGPISKSEIGVLQKTFQEMLTSLKQRDERQKVESETKLLLFEKQASVGKLAGGVAHEINNPLTGIVTFTHLLLKRNDLSPEVRSDLETIAQQTDRVCKIVNGLLDFSRQTELNRELTDVNSLCRSTVALVDNQALIKGIRLSFDQGEKLPWVTLDRNQMQSVLLNMIINALDATETGGHITVSTSIGMSPNDPDQMGVEIICNDSGCGIAPDHLDKIFDPFFTTKEVGQGTGLGLSVSYGIVERHGGTIYVQSKVGRGSTFIIWLPIEEQV